MPPNNINDRAAKEKVLNILPNCVAETFPSPSPLLQFRGEKEGDSVFPGDSGILLTFAGLGADGRRRGLESPVGVVYF